MTRDQQVTAIAEAFAEVMRQWLTPAEFAEMKVLNETPAYADGSCASHNYCDANMAMDAAYSGVTGRSVMHDAETGGALWSDAWVLARKLYLGHSQSYSLNPNPQRVEQ
jgi:hypothetical protein